MNVAHLNGKARSSEKAVPGCLGRMVNLFDITSAASGNRLLTDKPHYDGSLSRSRSDVSRMSSIEGAEMEDKVMVTELRTSSNKKSNGTPVKMLIAQEMSKDLDLKQSSPNVVAKLMGLDTLPKQEPDIASQRIHLKGHMRKSHSDIPVGYWQEENRFFDENFDGEMPSPADKHEYKDIHEILQQSQRTSSQRDKSPQKGRFNDNVKVKRLALIRQKFMEAKRLATDEKLRQTKEFQDALDVLSSNGDLFLKVLQEPVSLFSQPLYGAQSIPVSPETKRITVLRPSKMVTDDSTTPAGRDEKQEKKQFQVNQVNFWDTHSNGFAPTISTWKVNESLTQPTRIVVLKPSPAKSNGLKTVVSSTPSSPRARQCENFVGGPEDKDAREAREVAKEITEQMRENLAGHRRDETLLSSVFSNGYTGYESSFEKSEHEFGDDRNLSDSEVMSPTSRHSWDYVNRSGSPYLISSFSHASYSPESSVCREAKKRLSERWAMMASNKNNPEQRQCLRRSSTLGEMLALSEIKQPEICEEEFDNKPQDPRASTSCLNQSLGAGETGDELPRNLSRSKSVPVSSTAYGESLNVEVSDPGGHKVDIPKEITKAKATRNSFTGKVASLFFSKNRKSRKEKSSTSSEESQLATADTPGLPAFPGRISSGNSEFVLPPSQTHSGTVLMEANDKRLAQSFPQRALSVSQPCIPGIQGENLDQPSPVSVLEQLFEEDEGTILSSSRSADLHGQISSLCLSKSNLIDKSPPIGSIARTLSWDECCTETASSYPLNSPFVSPGAEDDEGEWLYLVQCLLTLAGLDDEEQVGSKLTRWHTAESPLDPLLRDKYIDLAPKEPLHEAKRRQLRSRRKLVFDCVNAALIDITGFGSPVSQWAALHVEAHGRFSEVRSVAEKVLVWMKGWFSSELKCLSLDYEGSDSLVERLVIKEVVGKGWTDQIKVEMDIIGKEIEGKLLEELVEECVIEWTGRD